MNIEITNNKGHFYQWDIGQTLRIDDGGLCSEVHFEKSGLLLACAIREEDGVRLSDVPDLLLQGDGVLTVFLVRKAEDVVETLYTRTFDILHRAKPENYVYTESEILTYSSLESRIAALEKGGTGTGGGVTEETDPTVPDWAKAEHKPGYTAEEVGALPADTEIPVVPSRVSAFENDAGYLTQHNTFIGDENTTVEEFYQAYLAGKVCFLRRLQGGSGITTWAAYNCYDSGANFYHINSAGRVEYGHLASDGSWNYTTVAGGGASSVKQMTLLAEVDCSQVSGNVELTGLNNITELYVEWACVKNASATASGYGLSINGCECCMAFVPIFANGQDRFGWSHAIYNGLAWMCESSSGATSSTYKRFGNTLNTEYVHCVDTGAATAVTLTAPVTQYMAESGSFKIWGR